MGREDEKVGVWVDPNACMRGGDCAEIAPEVFQTGHLGRICVKESGRIVDGEGPDAMAMVNDKHLDRVYDAAGQCPTGSIHLEMPTTNISRPEFE
jgi:ferredoxin